MKFTLFTSSVVENSSNVLYPNRVEITCPDEMDAAVKFDHVCAQFKNNRRHHDTFITSDVLVMDCDNDHTEVASEWITFEKLSEIFRDVSFVAVPSRNYNKVKGDKSARPRMHVYFPISEMKSSADYAALKRRIKSVYEFFDSNALDSARFMYASDRGKCIWHEGLLNIDEVLSDADENGTSGYPAITQGKRNNTLSRCAAKLLKRYGNTDEAYSMFLEMNNRCEPPLEDKELESIWNSALRFFKDTVLKDPKYIPPQEYNAPKDKDASQKAWDVPIPFSEGDLPVFPVEALPPVLRDFAVSVSKSTQTPVDMAAVGTLATASACMRNLYKVEGRSDWHEPTNIYAIVVAEPSERKSAVTSHVTKPVDSFVREYNENHKFDIEMSRVTKQQLESKKNALISKSKKANGSAAVDFDDDIRDVVQKIVDFKEVNPLKVYVDDTTPEKLVESLAENDGSLAVISSEGGIFDVLSGTYASKVNIDVYLKGYSAENISVERIMRPSVTVNEARLTILLSVQPVVISEFMSNKKFRHRGLTARFLYAMPHSNIGNRTLNCEPLDEESYLAYKELVYNLLSEKRKANAELITLNEEAKEILNGFYDWVEKKISGELSVYGDWLGKLVGNTLRIAGILARCSNLKKDVGEALLETDPPIIIDKKTMEDAICIGKYFLFHAVKAYGDMGVKTDLKLILSILDKIRERKMSTVTKRDIMRTCRCISSSEDAQNILDILEDYGYVRLSALDAADKLRNGRPRNALYAVNPTFIRG